MYKTNFKITPIDYDNLSVDLTDLFDEYFGEVRRYKGMGLARARFLWDVLHAVKARGGRDWTLYLYEQGLNDNHIETALKAIWEDFCTRRWRRFKTLQSASV